MFLAPDSPERAVESLLQVAADIYGKAPESIRGITPTFVPIVLSIAFVG